MKYKEMKTNTKGTITSTRNLFLPISWIIPISVSGNFSAEKLIAMSANKKELPIMYAKIIKKTLKI